MKAFVGKCLKKVQHNEKNHFASNFISAKCSSCSFSLKASSRHFDQVSEEANEKIGEKAREKGREKRGKGKRKGERKRPVAQLA